MTRFLARRIIQAFPTLVGITIICYIIMSLVPGGPTAALTLDPNLTPDQRRAIYVAAGTADPIYIQYFRWLIGDRPVILGGQPRWTVQMDNGQNVIINLETGDVVAIENAAEFADDASRFPAGISHAGSPPISERDARLIAQEAVPDANYVLVGYLPNYDGTVLWGGRKVPIFSPRGELLREEIGTRGGILRLDFGQSFSSRKSAWSVIGLALPATLELGVISLVVGLVIGIPVGVLAAVYQGSIFDNGTRVMAVIVSSVPVFFQGLVLLLIFGQWLQWLPMGNRFPISFTGDYTLWDRIRHMILPVLTLSSFTIAGFSRFMRASLLDVLNQDYVRTARAKGLSNQKVWFKHALRNALIPIATILGPAITGVIGGAVLTETIYSWEGMGRLVVRSVIEQDYPIIMAVVLLFSMATIMGYILSDILYAVFDPRIRLS